MQETADKKYIVTVVTSTRADYGLLRGVIRALQKRSEVKVRVAVTGTHLSEEYGFTEQEISANGIEIHSRIPILGRSTMQTLLNAEERFARYFSEYPASAVLLLGDRFEIFGVATAAAVAKLPIIHISGGDVTQGADDDFYRHCITKMAKLHFPSNEQSARRLICMGEQPSAVFNVGGLGDENIRTAEVFSRKKLGDSINFSLEEPFVLVTYHPETACAVPVQTQLSCLLEALDKTGVRCLFTKSNADEGGSAVNHMLDSYCEQHKDKAKAVASLGAVRYLSAMRHAAAVVGNSSSGVVETPSVGVPAVNIGSRQQGREICDNVICCPAETQAIYSALQKALSPEFREYARSVKSPYYGGNTAERIAQHTVEFLASGTAGEPKAFYDAREAE